MGPDKHNPWNEIECGDHYARTLASWGVLVALENFYFSGPEKILGFAPKIQACHFEGFFSAAEGWGNIIQNKTQNGQQNNIRLAYGIMALRQLELEVSRAVRLVQLQIESRKIPCTFTNANSKLVLHFDEQLIAAGQEQTVNTRSKKVCASWNLISYHISSEFFLNGRQIGQPKKTTGAHILIFTEKIKLVLA